jgi:hypothetical protein
LPGAQRNTRAERPLLLLALVSETIIYARYVIVASAPLFLLAAKGIRNINYNYAKFAVIASVVILSAANLQTYYTTALSCEYQTLDVLSVLCAKAGGLKQ